MVCGFGLCWLALRCGSGEMVFRKGPRRLLVWSGGVCVVLVCVAWLLRCGSSEMVSWMASLLRLVWSDERVSLSSAAAAAAGSYSRASLLLAGAMFACPPFR